LALYGPVSDRALRETAEQVREVFLQDPGITQVELSGIRDYEVSVAVPRDVLRQYNLTLGGIAEKIRRAATELPGGGINFLVDVERIKPGAFYWTPTPATICPIEYTMELTEYEEMGGHVEAMKPFRAKEPTRGK
jgi:hypothetical protein